jgi:chemotaxis protein methyltransferase CheR
MSMRRLETGNMEFIELKLEETEFQTLRAMVYRTAGISLADSKKALVVSRLSRRLRELEFRTFHAYIGLLQSDPGEIHVMINRLTTNFTKFYREKHQFEVLTGQILPMILDGKKKKREVTLRIWSAGCSSGEEVYTLLFEVLKTLKDRFNNLSALDMKILGSDIDTNMLHKARSGQYSDEEMRDLDHDTREAYFDRNPPHGYRIKKELRPFVGFRRINLAYDEFLFKHPMDIIFCRNVVIYFNSDIRQTLYEKFHAVLNQPGFFFSGHSENLFNYGHLFKLMEKSIYQKVVP